MQKPVISRKTQKRNSSFEWKPFSRRQLQVLTWWLPKSPCYDYDTIIADGSIRSGKTVSMIDSFVTWSLATFTGEAFIMAGRSMGALKRNVIRPMLQILDAKGIGYIYNRSTNTITCGGNTYFCFGAANEASQDTLQGLTAAGAFADEVALFPESFVNQMMGRCSVEGARIWMNCNPESPYHFIKSEYIDKSDEKRILHLHFTMDDNLSLSDTVKERYKRMYSGLWYKRFILGLWVMADGIIYDMFNDANLYDELPQEVRANARRYITIDYGTSNPMVFLDCYDDGETVWVDREYYYSGRDRGVQKTDMQYLKDFKEFVGEDYPDFVIIDPSAASFKLLLRQNRYRVKDADNDVLNGIRKVASAIFMRRLKVNRSCKNMIKEFMSYLWDEKAAERGVEQPMKQFDHAMDAIRYLVNTLIKRWRLPSEEK